MKKEHSNTELCSVENIDNSIKGVVKCYYCHVPFFFSCCVLFQGLPHYQRQAEPHSHIATTRLAERIAILLFTYIIGDILYIYTFGHFEIRHHQTCYTVSLSPNCHFLCKCYSAQLVKYLKQGTVRDAHIRTHTHARAHMRHTPTHILYHVHQEKHSGIARQRSSLRAARWSVYEGHGTLKMSFFVCLFYELICILPHQQAGPGFRIETVLIHRLKWIRVRVSAFANMHEQNKCTERTSALCDLYLSADLCVCACSGEANRACWRCTAARWLWWGEPLCSATPPAAAGCSAWGSAPRPAAPPCPLSPERHRHTTKQKPSLRSLWQEREGSDRYSGGFKETSGHT